jgi:hypothetical protein
LAQANIPNYNLTENSPFHTHQLHYGSSPAGTGLGVVMTATIAAGAANLAGTSDPAAGSGVSVNSGGSGTGANTISPFMLGTYFVKL